MATEALKRFSDELKFIRESKGITLQQIASRTKIDLKFLQAIEDANFDILPELYMRAFIKEYAQSIDINTKEILQKYDLANTGKIEEKPQIEKPQEESKDTSGIVQANQIKKEFDSLETKTEPIILLPTPFIKI
ncbi:MAG: helix-turn-helix domain-containing protein, partial [Bacteroidota bacterium]